MTLELFHWEPAGDSLKVLVCLGEKGLEFDGRYVDMLDFEQYRPEYLKLAPFGQAPVLVHNGTVFSEPRLLLEYLEDAFPAPSLAPSDAVGWYDVQERIRSADAQMAAAVNLIGWHQVMLPAMDPGQRASFIDRLAKVPVREQQAGWAAVVRDAESTEDRLENARGKIRESVERVERTLAAHPWLAGGKYSIADINAFAWVRPLPALMPADINEAKTPRIAAWLQRIATRPAVSKALTMGRRSPGQQAFPPPP